MGFLAWAKRLDDRVETAAHRKWPRLAARRDMPPEGKRRYFARVALVAAVVATAAWVLSAAGVQGLWGLASAATGCTAVFAFEAVRAHRAAKRGAPQPTRR